MAKRSLHMGINDYPGTKSDLHGCVNDARDWQSEMISRGFTTKVILDSQCTKANMVREIKKIISETKAGDIAVITYSGHGTWVPDRDGDEADGRDEALCPYDISRGQILLDDELYKMFKQRDPESQLIFISDSCHSGTVSRGFFNPWENDENCIAEDAQKRFLDTHEFLDDDIIGKAWKTQPVIDLGEEAAVFFSGCSDIEYSYDASFRGRPNGAFTFTALNALRKLPENASYQEWYNEIRKTLPQARYPQTPKIGGSDLQKNTWKIFDI